VGELSIIDKYKCLAGSFTHATGMDGNGKAKVPIAIGIDLPEHRVSLYG